MKMLIEIDEDLQKALTEYFEGKRSYVGLDNGIKLLEAVKNGKEIKDDISLPEKPNKSETKIDCDNADCNNCVNHKYCDYEKFDAVMDNMLKYPSTTKNDLPHCQHTDEEIAKSFIEDVEAVKDQLPCGEQMDFPNTFDEFVNDYGFKDKQEVYTNGSELIPVFRVKQWLEHINSSTTKNDVPESNVGKLEPTTKNDIVVNCISRADARSLVVKIGTKDILGMSGKAFQDLYKGIDNLPSVTPQEPRWIPVSEKLPELFTFVYATCRSLVDDRDNWVVETIYLPIPKEVNKHGYSDWGNIPMFNLGEAEVIAWVERIIPQPYKAESEK